MSEEEKFLRTEVKEIIVYLVIGILMLIIFPAVGGLILRGFEESFQAGTISLSTYLGAFIVYFFFMFASLFIFIFPIGRMVAVDRRDHPATQKNPSWFTIFTISLLFSPEENGALYRLFHALGFKKNPMRWSSSIFRCIIYGTLFFGALGILQISHPYLSVSGVPSTPQQISTASDVIFGASVPSFAENGLLLFVFFLLLGVDAYLCSRFIKNDKIALLVFFIIGFLVLSPAMGLFWASLHNIVYGDSDVQWFATFLFGWLGSSITLLFANFIFFLQWHFFNNFFLKLGKLISTHEDLIFVAWAIWGFLFIATFVVEYYLYKRRKKKRMEQIIIPE